MSTNEQQQSNFPPCTLAECTVDEVEKQKASSDLPPCAMTEKCVSACAAYGRVCPCAARIASMEACKALRELRHNSKVFVPDAANQQQHSDCPGFTQLDADDIKIYEKLGCGGFSYVNRCIVRKGDEAGQEFAVKYLKRRAMVDLHQFKHGAADLAVEAHFLHTLNHPNIVKLHGISAGSVENNFASGRECGFFIVVDRLYDTLEDRIEKWREEDEKNPGNIFSRHLGDYKERKRQDVVDRCRIAFTIASVMKYLHSLDIVFRDLKPDNIAFDKDGVLKIFDFGLAKELKPELKTRNHLYRLTGNTGSRRYMAPEVARDKPYDKSVDVFSFGILLWEMCAAEKPFNGYSSNKHMQQVVLGGERPRMDAHHTHFWPTSLQSLIKSCWATNPSERPTFDIICKTLVEVLRKGSDASIPNLVSDVSDSEEEVPIEPVSPSKLKGLFRMGRHKPPTPPKLAFGGRSKSDGSASGKRGISWGRRRSDEC